MYNNIPIEYILILDQQRIYVSAFEFFLRF